MMSLRRRIALLICPDLDPAPKGSLPVFCSVRTKMGNSQKVEQVPNRNVISALLALTDAFQRATALSDWEIAARAGVNNRAIKILRGGSPIHPTSTARLFEFFEEAWPETEPWPLDDATTARFGTVLTIPVIERLGGPDAMLALIVRSGRKRTKDAVLSWARRAGMPAYARSIAHNECRRLGMSPEETEFEPTRLTPAQITHLRSSSPSKKRSAA